MSDPAGRRTVQALDALRHGWPIAIEALGLLAVETADEATLTAFDPARAAPVLISAGRAATLKLANQVDAAVPDAPVLVDRAPWIDLSAAIALADPQFDLATPLKGPFRALPVPQPALLAAALGLARVAGLLPAFFVGIAGDAAVTLGAEEVFGLAPPALRIATRARLPLAEAEAAEIVAFRVAASTDEHVALVIGQPDGTPPLVRLHSECLTGDVFGSLKCDCGPQLDAGIAAIRRAGWGVLLYLRQEGRGIGLVNKLRAYRLQDQGFDTVDANTRLGFAVDARDFAVAAAMLRLLGQTRVRVMTNNPAKIAGLEAAGVAVVERVSHALPPNPHNARYLATKRDRTGHRL